MLTLLSIVSVLLIIPSSLQRYVLSCTRDDVDSLLSFRVHITVAPGSPPLNWSSTDCCLWEGVSCETIHQSSRVTSLSLPGRSLSGTISLTSLTNLSFLSHLNLSHNSFCGSLQTPLPGSIRSLDLSSNRLNGSLNSSDFKNLVNFNISDNSFTGTIPTSSICSGTPFLETLDVSQNQFNGQIPTGFGECLNLRVLRAGSNSLSGLLPHDIFNARTLVEISLPNNFLTGPIHGTIVRLSRLTILELHVNGLTGEIPFHIGSLSSLKQLILHTNGLSGTLPPSLTNCTNLKTLLLRNNLLTGDISNLDFSNVQRLQVVDLGNNTFFGEIPACLCLCRSLTAIRLAYNRLTGRVPPCMASLRNLNHLSLSYNYLSDVLGALRTLSHCENLAALVMSRSFKDELMPADNDLLYIDDGFQNLQVLSLGGCQLRGQISSWISNLGKLKVLNLSYNNLSGPIPAWLGSMPSLFVLNLTHNFLTGEIPCEIGRLPALIADNTSSDLSSLVLPFSFDAQQYNSLFNLPRALKVGYNRLSGNIPEEIGRLKLLNVLDLRNNEFTGRIPRQLSHLLNLERLNMSGNNLKGKIPRELTGLNFLSAFSVADNDLEGEIPKGGQFDTFGADSFEGNPKLCGDVAKRCHGVQEMVVHEEQIESSGYTVQLDLRYFVGLFVVMITVLFNSFWVSL